jgi:kinesin family protein 2/24
MRPDLHTMYMRHHTFSFDRVFSEAADNDEVYEETAAPLVRRAVEGSMATVFMFGQTGSGKTYTMSAIHERASAGLFEAIEAADSAAAAGGGSEEPTTSVFLTYVELAGDRCRDMLNKAAPVKMLTDASGEVHLRGVVEAPVRSAPQLLRCVCARCDICRCHRHRRPLPLQLKKNCACSLPNRLIAAAGKLRATAATGVHDQSSRSHALCRIILRRAPGAAHGMFTMVDLAGTERNKDSMHHDAKLRKEATEINRSLMALKDCVRERAQGAAHVSYRKDKLTQLLKSCFTSPDAYTVVVATVSPTCGDTEHTLSTASALSISRHRVCFGLADTFPRVPRCRWPLLIPRRGGQALCSIRP